MGRETSAFWALLRVGRGNAQQSDMSTVSSQQETFEEEAFRNEVEDASQEAHGKMKLGLCFVLSRTTCVFCYWVLVISQHGFAARMSIGNVGLGFRSELNREYTSPCNAGLCRTR